MTETLPISLARQNLSKMLKKLQQTPELVYEITLNGIPVGELRSPKAHQSSRQATAILLEAADLAGEPTESYPEGACVSEDHDAFLT